MASDKTLITISLVERDGRVDILDHKGELGYPTSDNARIVLELRRLADAIEQAVVPGSIERAKPLKFKPLSEPLTEPDIPSPQEAWRAERGL